MTLRSLVLSCLALFLAACANQATTSSQTASGANFGAYKTYTWAGTTPPTSLQLLGGMRMNRTPSALQYFSSAWSAAVRPSRRQMTVRMP